MDGNVALVSEIPTGGDHAAGVVVDSPMSTVGHQALAGAKIDSRPSLAAAQRFDGFDLLIQSGGTPGAIGTELERLCQTTRVALVLIANRRAALSPNGSTSTGDLWHCRFEARDPGSAVDDGDLFDLLEKIRGQYRWTHVERRGPSGTHRLTANA